MNENDVNNMKWVEQYENGDYMGAFTSLLMEVILEEQPAEIIR
jgi:hypothetical protein